MDPSLPFPAITEVHIAHAANPTPSHGPNPSLNPNPNPNPNHPPYAEMITAAITALKERNGSSRRAIAKYIERVYTNLPPTHSALLTHNLKRLKNSGHLVMVKHSYKLPRSDSSAPATTAYPPSASSSPKRGRGRPPKPKPSTEPMLIALGLVDGPASVSKRGPGRPPKVKSMSVGMELGGLMLGKRKSPGRPRRPKTMSGVVGPGGVKRGRGRPPKMANGLDLDGIKKGPGRPPKMKPMPTIVPYLNNVPVQVPVPVPMPMPQPRGRPKKDGSSRAKAPGRPRGRPPMNTNAAAGGGGSGVLLGTRPGRPLKIGGAKRPRKGTGKPVGRPRKTNALPRMETAEAAQWMRAYGEIENKLVYVQSRIKQAVGVLKPHFLHENANAVSAVAALQELEEISTMDIISAPLQHVQVQEPMAQPLHGEGQEPVIQNQVLH